jgi:ectoine hydroxylase-related dioxygenase (phytanoyl-CoA dioxygenase family)
MKSEEDTAIMPLIVQLARDGYCILPNAVPAETIAALEADLAPRFAATPFCEGEFYGERTKRFGRLLLHSPHAQALVRHRLVLDLVDAVLGPHCDRFNLNLTQAIEIHPGALPQFQHRDHDMWAGPKGRLEYLVNVMWPLTPFTAENGATMIWPGSNWPEWMDGSPVAAEAQPGEAILFLGSTLHGGGENRTEQPRRGVVVSYCLGWLKPFELQWLVYPPEVARGFDPELAALVGYQQHRPNLGNVEGRCPSLLLTGGDDGAPVAAKDALLPEQAEALAAHVAEQEAARAGLVGG